jgi:hypothetical protein
VIAKRVLEEAFAGTAAFIKGVWRVIGVITPQFGTYIARLHCQDRRVGEKA